ncbi:FKBP-type peptidyl-prolyl cis-trans isomerase [Trypanosoma conorhini]|uniref:peptidylprolyl isomerase n=1 Tax=Trypanosoma conorhini TaxID=83891 RepID=A0A3R7PLN1_9TRYP|nr:FKBP-type peptidyl-prolyl cis-trans isomerase [Trypanosoma conorhini]RNF21786.1 FKBP-type peptidyl-prolyl cis-trans isomerase [Trypanosoma conorhini]
MGADSAERRGGGGAAAGGGSPPPEDHSETTAAAPVAPQDAATGLKPAAPPPAPRPSGLAGNYTVWLAALVLLLAVGRWKYDAYMRSVDEELLQTRYTEYLIERWSRDGESLLANVSRDPSFTQYKGTRIYFRALTRAVPIPGTKPVEFKLKIGLPEVDDENRWRGDDDDKGRELRSKMRCVGEEGLLHLHIVGLLSNGMRFTSSYAEGVGAEQHTLERCVPCLQKLLPMMCTGDKWEIICPPGEGYGNAGADSIPPGATTVWRISVESVDGNKPRGWREAEALLAASVTHVDGTPPMTRKQLFETPTNICQFRRHYDFFSFYVYEYMCGFSLTFSMPLCISLCVSMRIRPRRR